MTKRAIILSVLLCVPMFAFAQKNTSGLVPCGIADTAGEPVPTTQQCDFQDLINLTQGMLNFIIYELATPIAILMFAYAGFKLVWSDGDTGAEKSARAIFKNTLIGYGVMLAAFLIVKLGFSFFFTSDYSLLS
jgi:hypothetical protein